MADEFTKIEVINPTQEMTTEPQKKKMIRSILIVLAIIAVLAGGLFVAVGLPILAIKQDIYPLMADAKEIPTGIKEQDLNKTISKLDGTKKSLVKLQTDYNRLGFIKVIPFLGNYWRDGDHGLKGAMYLIEAGEVSVKAIEPYADIIGFAAKEDNQPKKDMTAEERLEMALTTLDKIQPNLDQIAEKLQLAQGEVNQINPKHYPEKLFGKNIRPKITELITTVDSSTEAVMEIKPAVGLLKPLLGIPSEKNYMLIFQNDAELRPTGGFLTAYALINVQKGKFKPLGSYDIYGIDAKFGNRLKAPEPILKYHKNVSVWHLRDMNLSPDFKESMTTFWENYRKVGQGNLDGIIAIDTKVLVDILKVLGPIGVADWGNFTAENDKRCNCPQVFYELEKIADQPVGEVRAERKAVLGPLMHSVLLNIMQSPRKKWPEFFDIAFKNIQEKHVLFYFFDDKLQQGLEAMNAAGRIKDYDADYLHLNDCNFAGAKSNMFIEQSILQQIDIDGSGKVTKTVTVDYKNPAPASNCNLEAGELCLNGQYRDWVRLYVPKGSKLISINGSEVQPVTYDELGKTVFEAFYGNTSPLRPQGKAQLVFKYELPFTVDKNQPYRMLIQKQPGTKDNEYTINIAGKEEIFNLSTDRELKLSL